MDDDLVKRLRDAAKTSEALAVLLPHSEGNATAKLFNEAADAIEELSNHPSRGGRVMKIEITYNNGEKYTAYLAEESYKNVISYLMDDASVSVLHSMGKAEEGKK